MQPQPPTPSPRPITIKSYGLIEFTKKQYVLLQLGVFFLGFPLIAVTTYFISLSGIEWITTTLVLVAVIAFIGELIETATMLVLFHIKERRMHHR